MIIYYGDVNLENFVYNEQEKRVKIIDLEYIIIVERRLFSDKIFDEENINYHGSSPNKYCTTYMPDYNIKQGIRYKINNIVLH